MSRLKRFIQSLRYAGRGLAYIWTNEQNFRIQTVVGIVILITMMILRVSTYQSIILIMLIIFVLVLEMGNTVIEKLVDILHPRIHTYIKVIKDLMAAAVLVAAIGSICIASLIFGPYILQLIHLLIQ